VVATLYVVATRHVAELMVRPLLRRVPPLAHVWRRRRRILAAAPRAVADRDGSAWVEMNLVTNGVHGVRRSETGRCPSANTGHVAAAAAANITCADVGVAFAFGLCFTQRKLSVFALPVSSQTVGELVVCRF
jgi:hypothetical protein